MTSAMKNHYVAVLLMLTVFFGTVLGVVPYVQVAQGLNKGVYFHFKGIGLLGSNVIVKVTGSKGEYQLWRLWLAPAIGSEFTRQINTVYGFKHGEKVTACITDVIAPKLKSCYPTRLNFNSGTDIYLTVRRR